MKFSLSRAAAAASSAPAALLALGLWGGDPSGAFSPQNLPHARRAAGRPPLAPWPPPSSRRDDSLCRRHMSEQPPDESGADLAAQFFRAVSDRNISFEGDEVDFADAEEEELTVDEAAGEVLDPVAGDAGEELDDDDDAILREYNVAGGEGSLTDGQIYDEVKDRVLESAGAFVELTKGAEEGGDMPEGEGAVYKPPTNVPDSGLTAGEVVELVLSALRNNDVPTPDYGVQVLFGYSGPDSQITEQVESEGLTPAQYRAFLTSSEDNLALFDHVDAIIDKADFSPDRLKGYFTARLMRGTGSAKDDVSVNFILSATGKDDDDCWMIDSMLIRPSKLRRRRRRR
ncbi:hypothetical protein ACHAWF_005728 [Thalassiosira exigua]